MYTFKDKKDRNLCLLPEVTAVIQEIYNEEWTRRKKPVRVFYCQKCFRYENPQAGRYREFTQLGIECLGGSNKENTKEVKELLKKCLNETGVQYSFSEEVKRGLSYYTDLGFEASCQNLGAQKQIAGGGEYKEGVGWAIGIDRLQLALEKERQNKELSA